MIAPILFNKDHHDALVQARTGLGVVADIIQKAQLCGMDVQDKENRRKEYDQILALYQQHFMSHLAHE